MHVPFLSKKTQQLQSNEVYTYVYYYYSFKSVLWCQTGIIIKMCVKQICYYFQMKKLTVLCLLALVVSTVWVVDAKKEEDADEESEKKDKKDTVGTVIGIDLGTTYSW